MQLFSLPPAATPAGGGEAPLGLLVAWIVLTQLFAILGYWISSKVVVGGERARFLNAVKVWALALAVLLILAITLGVVFGLAIFLENQVAGICMLGGWALLVIGLTLYVPAKIYDIGLFRSLGFILLSGIISGAATVGADQIAGLDTIRRTAFAKLSRGHSEDPWSRMQVLLGRKDEIDVLLDKAAAGGKTESPQHRQAALRDIRKQLEARYKSLAPSDEAAKATYTAQQQRYQQLVDALKADMGKAPGR